MTEQQMVYVASDPDRPDLAWGICAEGPKLSAQVIAGWLRRGAVVTRVMAKDSRVMLAKWIKAQANKTEETP